MKSSRTLFILLPVFLMCALVECYAQFDLYLLNSTDCPVQYQVFCVSSACADANVISGTLGAGLDATHSNFCTSPLFPDFGYVQFRFPTGTGDSYDITFDPNSPDGCSSAECITDIPFFYGGGDPPMGNEIEEEYCLGADGGVRTGLVDGVCSIIFEYEN